MISTSAVCMCITSFESAKASECLAIIAPVELAYWIKQRRLSHLKISGSSDECPGQTLEGNRFRITSPFQIDKEYSLELRNQ